MTPELQPLESAGENGVRSARSLEDLLFDWAAIKKVPIRGVAAVEDDGARAAGVDDEQALAIAFQSDPDGGDVRDVGEPRPPPSL